MPFDFAQAEQINRKLTTDVEKQSKILSTAVDKLKNAYNHR